MNHASKTPNFNVKIQKIHSELQPGARICSVTGKEWDLEPDEIEWCKKFNVPVTEIEPVTRLKMLMANSTGLSLWWKPHMKTGEPILSYIHPDNPAQVVRDKEWQNLDNTDCAMDLKTNEPFFERLYELYKVVPFRALGDPGNSENSIGISLVECRDSFMIFGAMNIEKSAYVYGSLNVTESVDITNTLGGVQDSWSTNRCRSLYNCHVALESNHCLNSWFLFDCWNSEFCFGATNQRNKKYLWFDKQLTKEEWEKRRAGVDLSCDSVFQEYKRKFFSLVRGAAWPENFNIAATKDARSSTGEYLEDTVRVRKGYNLQKCVDCLRVWFASGVSNSAYVTGIGMASELWCVSGGVSSQNMKFCIKNPYSQALEYCVSCINCVNCFGCVGLNHKKFCILNKQYSEEDYWKKLDELKCVMLERGEYGQLLPARVNTVGAQFSAGDLLLNYSEDEVRLWGADVYNVDRGTIYMPDQLKGARPIKASNLPDCVIDAKEIEKKPIFDEVLGRTFSVHPMEAQFYREHKTPIPREHFLTRLKTLARFSNSAETEKTICGMCGKEIAHNKNMTFNKKAVLCKEDYIKYLETR